MQIYRPMTEEEREQLQHLAALWAFMIPDIEPPYDHTWRTWIRAGGVDIVEYAIAKTAKKIEASRAAGPWHSGQARGFCFGVIRRQVEQRAAREALTCHANA
jgi:hypothetical protein